MLCAPGGSDYPLSSKDCGLKRKVFVGRKNFLVFWCTLTKNNGFVPFLGLNTRLTKPWQSLTPVVKLIEAKHG